MLVKTYGAAVQGVDAITVTIEVSTERGFAFIIVGLPDASVKESYTRVQSAIKESGMEFPRRHVTINMAPADVRKEGAAYDLPVAIGILASADIIPREPLDSYMIMGELSFDGSVRPIRGVLPMAILARSLGFKGMIVPRANATEAAVVNRLDILGVDSLSQVVSFFKGQTDLQPTVVNTREEFARTPTAFDVDFSEVKGQDNVKRAFEVAAAGGHNILMVGPPGSGKSMMARRLPTIMPPLTMAEALETTKIHSVAGTLRSNARLMTARPFRAPHHTISPVALVGGGSNPRPGEISLAHNGVLFLDEFPEYSRVVLEVLRQPLEDRCITVSRARYSVDYPAAFMLVASMNPCPCGYYNHPTKQCTCPPGAVSRYMSRISGPLLDRIDLQIEIFPVGFDNISDNRPSETSAAIRDRVVNARNIQSSRFAADKGIHCNAQMNSRLIRLHCNLGPDSLDMLRQAMTRLDMSARAYDRILKVARTIADLEAAPDILPHHISEAISYRNLDRGSWGSQSVTLPG